MKSEQEIISFIKNFISRTLNIDVNSIKEDLPLDAEYGLESMDALSLGAELEDWLGVELEINFFFEHRTIAELVKAVMKQKG